MLFRPIICCILIAIYSFTFSETAKAQQSCKDFFSNFSSRELPIELTSVHGPMQRDLSFLENLLLRPEEQIETMIQSQLEGFRSNFEKVEAFEKGQSNLNQERKDLTPFLDLIYFLYSKSHEDSSTRKFSDRFKQSLSSFEAFMNQYCPNCSASFSSQFIISMTSYNFSIVHQGRIFSESEIKEAQVHLTEGDWVTTLSVKDIMHRALIVDRSVLTETLQLIKQGYKESDYYHDSGSAALQGIGKFEKILSAKEVLERGEQIRSGEVITGTYQHRNGKHLSEVYATKGVSRGYATTRWFNEYPVGFGISKSKLNFKMIKDFGGYHYQGEILLGNEVPLAAVEYIYAPKLYESHIRKWAAKYCPWAKFVSFEATNVLLYLKQ